MNKEIKIIVTDREGNTQEHIAPTDMNLNLMEFLKAAEYPVLGTCGGMALCSSCHVYILSEHHLPDMSADEEQILDQAFYVDQRSRLACQIQIQEGLDQLHIEIAPDAV